MYVNVYVLTIQSMMGNRWLKASVNKGKQRRPAGEKPRLPPSWPLALVALQTCPCACRSAPLAFRGRFHLFAMEEGVEAYARFPEIISSSAIRKWMSPVVGTGPKKIKPFYKKQRRFSAGRNHEADGNHALSALLSSGTWINLQGSVALQIRSNSFRSGTLMHISKFLYRFHGRQSHDG